MPTAFDRLLGTTQGRIEPTGTTAPQGSFVFCLGSDTAGVEHALNLGDNVKVVQRADVTGLKLIRFTALVRGPAAPPAGTRWVAEWGIDNQVHGRRTLGAGDAQSIRDGVINVTGLVGDHDIFFRLRFMGVTGIAAEVFTVAPSFGVYTGGTPITLTGAGFTGATGATVGDVALTSFVVVNDTTITGVIGAHALADDVDVIVLHPAGNGALLGAFDYRYPPPVVAGIAPNTGPQAGGTAITVTGTGFRAGATVRLSGSLCTSIVVVNSTTITCVTPSYPTVGPKTCRVQNTDGQFGDLLNAFTYVGGVAPVLSVLSFNLADTAGGTDVTVVGTDLGSASGVTVGGTSATITSNTSTRLTFTMPAKSAGNHDVVVTTAGGASNALSIEVWSPQALALSRYHRASYGAPPWAGVPSAGISGGQNLTEATNPPSAGAPVNGKAPAVFDGVNDKLASAIAAHISRSSYTYVGLVKPLAAPAQAAVVYDDPALFQDIGGNYGLSLSNNNVRLYHNDLEAGVKDLTSPAPSGSYHFCIARYDGTNMRLQVGGVDAPSKPAVDLDPSYENSSIRVGVNYGTAFAPMELLELAMSAVSISDVDCSKWLRYAHSRYPAAFAPRLDVDLVDKVGGVLRVRGAGLGGATVTLDGSPLVPTSASTSLLVLTVPALSVGAHTVVVTTASGASFSLPFEAWSPEQLPGVDAFLDARFGVTEVSGAVSSWLSRVNGLDFKQSNASRRPTLVAGAFGAAPGIRFPGASVRGLTLEDVPARQLANGRSYFAVAKWTSAKNTSTAGPIVPLPIIAHVAAWTSFGANAGALSFLQYNTVGSLYHFITEGSGLNDGRARLIGVTTDTVPNEKLYVGTVQQGATNSPAGVGYHTHAYDTIGYGYSALDPFEGDLAAVIAVDGVISAGNLVKLNKWARAFEVVT